RAHPRRDHRGAAAAPRGHRRLRGDRADAAPLHRSRAPQPPGPPAGDEQRALMEASLAAGARSVHLIEESLAAAIGAGLAIGEPRASVVVDVGGGTSEVAVISLGGIVVSRSQRTGGYDLDETVAAWLRNT